MSGRSHGILDHGRHAIARGVVMAGDLVAAIRRLPDEGNEGGDDGSVHHIGNRCPGRDGLSVEVGRLRFPAIFERVGKRDDPGAGERLRELEHRHFPFSISNSISLPR